MANLLDTNMRGLLYDPMFQMGVGLLSAGSTPGGSIASGLQTGMSNIQAMQQGQMQRQLMEAKLAEHQQQVQQRQRQQAVLSKWQRGEELTPAELYYLDPGAAVSSTLPDPTTLERNLIAAGYQPGTPEFNEAMRGAIMKPQTVVNNVPELPAGYVPVDPNDLSKGVKPIPGSGKDPKNTSEYRKVDRQLKQVQGSVDSYEKLLNQYGAEVMPGKGKLELRTAYTNLLLDLKDLYNMGALQGPDLELMQQIIMDPTTFEAKGTEVASGRDSLVGQLGLVRQKLQEARQNVNQQYGADTQGTGRSGKVLRYNPQTGRVE